MFLSVTGWNKPVIFIPLQTQRVAAQRKVKNAVAKRLDVPVAVLKSAQGSLELTVSTIATTVCVITLVMTVTSLTAKKVFLQIWKE